jgi:hypothetical protein
VREFRRCRSGDLAKEADIRCSTHIHRDPLHQNSRNRSIARPAEHPQYMPAHTAFKSPFLSSRNS